MTAKHLLVSTASRSESREEPDLPFDIKYDSQKGYWSKQGIPLVEVGELPPMASLKRDQETGEDLKGT